MAKKSNKNKKDSVDLSKWDPARDLAAFKKAFSDMFDDFWSHKNFALSVPSLSNWAKGIWQPAVDIHENKKDLVISASLAGLKKEDIKVDIDEDVITISGEKKEEKEQEDKNYYRREQSYGSFQRSIKLPDYVDADKAKAAYKNGVLEIKIPKIAKPPRKGKKLDIE
jgi:HSP20 family protein